MVKNIDDFIVPEKRRSIRDIPIPENRRKFMRPSSAEMKDIQPKAPQATSNTTPIQTYLNELERQSLRENGSVTPPPNPPKPPKRKKVWFAGAVAIVVLVFVILSIFNGATLAYVPKSAPVSFNNDIFNAKKSGEGSLLYSIVKLSKDKGMDAPTSGEEQLSRKASGTIIVYNNASNEPQRLIATTRFESSNGLVYRVPNDIVIPGRRTVSGVVQPGSVEVVVQADEAGEKYNIALSDFTLPGLANTPRFSTIYARSKTNMTGGFVGTEKAVSSQDKAKIRSELETTLREELFSEARAQVPDGFILFQSLSAVTFEELPQTTSVNRGNVTLNLRGNFYGVIFKRSELFNHLVKEKASIAPGETVNIINADSLDISFIDIIPENLVSSDEINFSITGEANVVWVTDEVSLKADLMNKHKRDVPSILNNYPTVSSATATIRPFWKTSFPDDGSRITIKQLPIE